MAEEEKQVTPEKVTEENPVTPTPTQALKAAAFSGAVYAEYIYLPGFKGKKEEPKKIQEPPPPKDQKVKNLKFGDMPPGAIGYRTYIKNVVVGKKSDQEEVQVPQPAINYSPDTLFIDATGAGSTTELTDEYVATRRVTGKVHMALKADMEALDTSTLRKVQLKDVLGRKILIEGNDIRILKPDSKDMAPTLISAEGLKALVVSDEDSNPVIVPLNAFDIIKDTADEELRVIPPAPIIKGKPVPNIQPLPEGKMVQLVDGVNATTNPDGKSLYQDPSPE